MDVSFADHSHIIGKGGNTIKKGEIAFSELLVDLQISYDVAPKL